LIHYHIGPRFPSGNLSGRPVQTLRPLCREGLFIRNTDHIGSLLVEGLRSGVYPGAVLLVGARGEIVYHKGFGHCTLYPEAFPMNRDCIFDLASLTKPLATTLGAMSLVEAGSLDLDEPLGSVIGDELAPDKRGITPRLLLNHRSGLPAWRPYYLGLEKESPFQRKASMQRRISEEPLVSSPGAECAYSDLGFMMLEWVIETVAGMPMAQFLEERFYGPLDLGRIFLWTERSAERFSREQFSATEMCQWRGRIIRGETHDENAHAVGGYSGHAGLFGTAEAVFRLCSLLMDTHAGSRDEHLSPETVRHFFTRQETVRGSTWALGWDTPSREQSSSGHFFSKNSVGHLGFTGTSVWMDLEREVMVILLTNRVHPDRKNDKIKAFRPIVHDTVMESMGLT